MSEIRSVLNNIREQREYGDYEYNVDKMIDVGEISDALADLDELEEKIKRLEEAERAINLVSRFFSSYNHHSILCNFKQEDGEWCNCGVADVRTYMKKYKEDEWEKIMRKGQ